MSKDEKKNKGLDKILKIVKDILILKFNKQNQEGKGLKILTTNQLLKKVYIIIMETIFMNTEKSKTNEWHRFRLDLTDKLNLKNPKITCLY